MDYVMDNTVGTVNLLEFARLHQPQLGSILYDPNKCYSRHISDRFIYFSTNEVFGQAPQGVSYSEYDRYSSGNPYAASKVLL